ncbi:MAG: AmmeMemoRadiSam system protein A [Ignavibacteriaceae bacterium]|nr:AmmeMemoRadiSam system protein A [Ignavibacteriaceae bacterium]
MEISEEEKKVLLNAARHSIKSKFTNEALPACDYEKFPNLAINAGAFVTLSVGNQLRGCIGYIVSDKPLFQTVVDAARQAAFKDPRFLPLNKAELDLIEIEISVLSPPFDLNDYNEIEIGKHGLILDELQRALLLPQVPVEHNMNLEEFLTALCRKAGLPGNTWRERQIKLKAFTANVFSEETNGGRNE